ncbi:MAG: CDP-diacylglycerol--glycerol-3-phosphate 3-phosphatidyltransferase [Planctomycetota bacterium]|jgi:CDP-diacylglycerol--glycerol-3-phosphate 3-phosphatidyltransferase
MLRLLLAIVSFAFLLLIQEDLYIDSWRREAAWIALFFFIAATAGDALDGYIARRDNTVTAFGRIADPFVDKVIVCSSLVFLASIPETTSYLHPWMVAVVLFREFLVNGIRGYMESQGIDFGAEMAGKIKMVVQSLAIGWLIGVIATQPTPPAWIHYTSHVLVWVTVILTIYSGGLYVVKASQHIGTADI